MSQHTELGVLVHETLTMRLADLGAEFTELLTAHKQFRVCCACRFAMNPDPTIAVTTSVRESALPAGVPKTHGLCDPCSHQLYPNDNEER